MLSLALLIVLATAPPALASPDSGAASPFPAVKSFTVPGAFT